METENNSEFLNDMPFAVIEVGKFLIPSAHDPALKNVVIELVHSKHFHDEDTLPSEVPDFGKLRRLDQATVYGLLKGIVDGENIGRINHPRGDSFLDATMWLRMENLNFSGYRYNPYRPADCRKEDQRHHLTLAAEFCGTIGYYRRIFRQMEKD